MAFRKSAKNPFLVAGHWTFPPLSPLKCSGHVKKNSTATKWNMFLKKLFYSIVAGIYPPPSRLVARALIIKLFFASSLKTVYLFNLSHLTALFLNLFSWTEYV